MKIQTLSRALRAWALGCALLAGAPALAADTAPLQVVYPNLNGNGTANLGYRVLKLALEKSGQAYDLSVDPRPANDERARLLLQAGEISTADFGSGADFEKRFAAIYFPIDQGLLGYRLFIIHRDDAPRFAQVQSLEDLQRFAAGQGLGWSNNQIMSAAGLEVVTGPTLESLFPMLEARRFDFLPLGLNEVYGFQEQYRKLAPSSLVETHLVLIYPFARLFYVRQGDTALRKAVEDGLRKAFDDSSFQHLLNNDPAIRAAVLQANLRSRVQIRIGNPTLTKAFRAIPPRYFFDLRAFK
ncbi:hypothetical protein [Niveibacterium sp. SC-1]|uniref:hypothetical protein n=1 Tax=Niveibacterium sp. SC-1 TaxID=3135646 RepID=UPI00311E5C01